MKVVILCGGRGTRLMHETEIRPKPLIKVGTRPLLWHIMKTYAYYGFNDFVICLGYKGEMIRDYFLNYENMNTDFTIHLGTDQIKLHGQHQEQDWKVTLADTGENTQIGCRIKKVEKYIDEDTFMVTYGDGLIRLDINELLAFHRNHNKIATVTGVQPSSRFGELIIDGDCVLEFNEKPQVTHGYISGGYFVFNKKIFSYLNENEDCTLEREPLQTLAQQHELMVYRSHDFWQCADTYREVELLNHLWKSGNPPWKVWK